MIIHPVALIIFSIAMRKQDWDCYGEQFSNRWSPLASPPLGPAGLCVRQRGAPPRKRRPRLRSHNPSLSISSAQPCPPRLFGHFGGFLHPPSHLTSLDPLNPPHHPRLHHLKSNYSLLYFSSRTVAVSSQSSLTAAAAAQIKFPPPSDNESH